MARLSLQYRFDQVLKYLRAPEVLSAGKQGFLCIYLVQPDSHRLLHHALSLLHDVHNKSSGERVLRDFFRALHLSLADPHLPVLASVLRIFSNCEGAAAQRNANPTMLADSRKVFIEL